MNLLKKSFVTLGLVSLAGTAMAEVKQPLEVVNRPITSPAGQGVAGVAFGLSFFKTPQDESDTFKGLSLGAAYGVDDKIEIGLSYGTFLEDGFDFKGPLSLSAAYNLSSGGPLHLAPNLSIGYDTLGEAITPLTLGARVRYNLDDKMAIYSPGNQLSISVDAPVGGGGSGFTYPVAVANPVWAIFGALADASDENPIYLTLPVGFGYQVNSNLFVAAETNLAYIEIADADTKFIFDSYLPVGLRGIYAVNEMIDVGLTYDIDLDDTDFSTLGLFARAFF